MNWSTADIKVEHNPGGICSPAPAGVIRSQKGVLGMVTRPLGKNDYDYIVQVIDKWWGGPTSALAHPVFFYELGDLARVVEQDGIIVGFLLGFLTPASPPVGYVHLLGIHPDYRRRGVGRILYQTFEEDCRERGCKSLKGISTVGNEVSLAFHKMLGWDAECMDDYAGPARRRVVYNKSIA